MEVITFESESFKTLVNKIDLMAKLLVIQQKDRDREGILDLQELSSYLKVSKSTIQRLKDSGSISFIKSGRKIYFRKSDVEAFLQERMHEADQ